MTFSLVSVTSHPLMRHATCSASAVHTFELSGVQMEVSMVAKLAVGLKNNTVLKYLTFRKVRAAAL